MSRWNELKYSLVLVILFPRFCLFVLLPFSILFVIPSPSAFPWLIAVLQPSYAKAVLACSLLLFGLSVVANLSISRYLRLHQTQSSPYTYETEYDASRRSSYFRIQVSDKTAFRRLLHDIGREHSRELIRLWLLVDDLVFVPPVLVLSLFMVVFMLLPWLVNHLWKWLHTRKPHPTPP